MTATALMEDLAGAGDRIAALAGSLIRCRSENPPGDERAVVAEARRVVEQIPGVTCRVVSAAPGRDSLVATAGPSTGRTLLLGAHLDTVPAGDGWTRDPFGGEVERGAVHGRGASDNKGAAAAMIAALATLVARNVTEHHRVVLVLNSDEEAGGRLGMDHVRDVLGESVDAAVVGEPSGVAEPFETLYIAARGASRFSLRAHGTSGHTSLVRRATLVNAIDVVATAIDRLRDGLDVLRRTHPLGDGADLIVVRLEGGRGWGVVPGDARADVELRVMPGTDQAHVEAQLHEALQGTDVELTFAPGSMRWVAPSDVEPGHTIVRAAAGAWEAVLGVRPPLGCFPGGTDGRSLSERSIPTIPGLGPGTLLRAHAAGEYVTTRELVAAAQIYALTAHAFLCDEGSPP